MVEGSPNHEYYLYAAPSQREAIQLPARDVHWRPVELTSIAPGQANGSAHALSLADRVRLWRAVRQGVKRDRLRTFFLPSLRTWFPTPLALPSVVAVHDPDPGDAARRGFERAGERRAFRLSARLAAGRARALVCPGEFVAERLAENCGVARGAHPGKIRVARPAPSATFRAPASPEDVAAGRGRANLPGGARTLLYVGGFGGQENVAALVRAHALLARRRERPPYLVLVGDGGASSSPSQVADLRVLARAGGSEAHVRWLEGLGERELRGLVADAVCCVQPGYADGLALAAVDAAAQGTPSVATIQGSAAELLGGATLPCDPFDPATPVEGLERLIDGAALRGQLGARAREAALALDWKSAARELVVALADVSRIARFPLLPWVASD